MDGADGGVLVFFLLVAAYFGFTDTGGGSAVTGSGATAIETVTAVGDFGDNKGIRRIWQALQLIQGLRAGRAVVGDFLGQLRMVQLRPVVPKRGGERGARGTGRDADEVR